MLDSVRWNCVCVCTNRETKIVLKGSNTVQLTDLATKAGNLGLPNYSVQDAGKTQVKLCDRSLEVWKTKGLVIIQKTFRSSWHCRCMSSHSLLPPPRRLCFCQTLFVCLFVCMCVCVQDNSKSYGRIFLKFLRACRAWHKLQVIKFWGWSGRNPGFWITLKFSLPLH